MTFEFQTSNNNTFYLIWINKITFSTDSLSVSDTNLERLVVEFQPKYSLCIIELFTIEISRSSHKCKKVWDKLGNLDLIKVTHRRLNSRSRKFAFGPKNLCVK